MLGEYHCLQSTKKIINLTTSLSILCMLHGLMARASSFLLKGVSLQTSWLKANNGFTDDTMSLFSVQSRLSFIWSSGPSADEG